MGKVRDSAKEKYWRGVIRRQRKSGETMAAFCAREGVSADRFYWWRRALRSRDRQLPTDAQVFTSDEQPEQGEVAVESFVPVRLPFLTQAAIEMVHPGGCVLRVPVGFDVPSLRRILATLDLCCSNDGEK